MLNKFDTLDHIVDGFDCVLQCKSRIAVQFTFLFQEKRINTCIMNKMLKRKRLVFTTINSMVFISKLV